MNDVFTQDFWDHVEWALDQQKDFIHMQSTMLKAESFVGLHSFFTPGLKTYKEGCEMCTAQGVDFDQDLVSVEREAAARSIIDYMSSYGPGGSKVEPGNRLPPQIERLAEGMKKAFTEMGAERREEQRAERQVEAMYGGVPSNTFRENVEVDSDDEIPELDDSSHAAATAPAGGGWSVSVSEPAGAPPPPTLEQAAASERVGIPHDILSKPISQVRLYTVLHTKKSHKRTRGLLSFWRTNIKSCIDIFVFSDLSSLRACAVTHLKHWCVACGM